MNTPHVLRMTAAEMSLSASTAAFVTFLNQLPESVAIRPLPGGWTPAGHASHLALTNDVFRSILQHGAGCSSPLPPFPGTSDFSDEAWSLDAPPKVAAPSILVPGPGIGCADAVAQLRESVVRLAPVMAATDQSTARLCVKLPWNVVSLYQMCEWAGGHTVRHLTQVNRELQIAAVRGAGV